ncbi:hypothetical protein BRE01_67500 [Brevibacillus reuszeri]|uniref:Uncharacterized protein n=1 Tax=Brevibacillus reuszeri TaxID=54915 RepID=A0A0K9YN79_9BACL|nr:hypothetical protein [Brevibacillus reuszeri]KNB70198.1 hypothetical protein ADS79_14610 [Brevibacillus reuszeri]GED73048.1 hypothetical protein BRE01_67500 [Brevibacillus reuszeri]
MNHYPNDLYHYNVIQFNDGSNTDISAEKINQWINGLIEELNDSEDAIELSISSGNTWVCVTKKEDKEGEFHVIVAKNYWSGTVKKTK